MSCNYFSKDGTAEKCFSKIGLYGKNKITEPEYIALLVKKYETSFK